jgi:hypothetical protein
MGQLRYGDSTVLDIDDDTLAHFQVVIVGKLRVHESLILAWTDTVTGVRSSLWIHSHVQIAFVYTEPAAPQISPSRLHALRTHVEDTGTLRRLPCPESLEAEPADLVSENQKVSGRP